MVDPIVLVRTLISCVIVITKVPTCTPPPMRQILVCGQIGLFLKDPFDNELVDDLTDFLYEDADTRLSIGLALQSGDKTADRYQCHSKMCKFLIK